MAEHPLRDYARTKVLEYVKFPVVARNVERSIYNYAVQNTREASSSCPGTMKNPETSKSIEYRASQTSTWECRSFRWRYKHKLMHLLASFKRGNMVEALKDGKLKIRELANYPPSILEPEGPYSQMAFNLMAKDLAMETSRAKEENYTGLFKCGKCKSVKTTYYQMQTRSADEVSQKTAIVLKCVLTPQLNSP
jgi:DNA-directed RNA polymerase subunit M/transcription elongation factor TFIIS